MNTPTEPNTTQGAQTANPDPVNPGTQDPNVQNPSALSSVNDAVSSPETQKPANVTPRTASQADLKATLHPANPVHPVQTPSASASSADSALKPHPKSSLAVFTPEQLAQISTWVQTEKYDKASELILEKFGHKISTGALFRFLRNTVAIVEQLEDTPETAAAAAEILQLAANANHKFTEASLHVLEQTAFKLSLTCVHKTSDLDLLNRINNIICRSRNTAVRERHATVQEKKADLRTRELDLKTRIFHARLDGRLNSNGRPTPSRNPNLFPEDPENADATPSLQNQNWWGDYDSRSEDPQEGSKLVPNFGSQPAVEPIPFSSDESCNQNQNCGGTRSPSPTSHSRDAITNNAAAPADHTSSDVQSFPAPNSEIKNQTSEREGSPLSTLNTSVQSTQAPTRTDLRSTFLNPEVANNRLYEQKLDRGEIKLIFAPGKHFELEYCNPADRPTLERMHRSHPVPVAFRQQISVGPGWPILFHRKQRGTSIARICDPLRREGNDLRTFGHVAGWGVEGRILSGDLRNPRWG